jgi:pimeloyl-ACP methyl ester carboxylesterase
MNINVPTTATTAIIFKAVLLALLLLCGFVTLYRSRTMSGSSSRLKTIILNPTSGAVPTATLIFAHGLGDSGAGWYDVAQMLSARPNLRHVRFVLPNAPMQPVSLNFGQKVSCHNC